jgi:hypothetical protein
MRIFGKNENSIFFIENNSPPPDFPTLRILYTRSRDVQKSFCQHRYHVLIL